MTAQRNAFDAASDVTTLAGLKALTGQDNYIARITEGGRAGTFRFDSSDLSTEVTADTQEGIYVAPDSDATGASGAWVRQYGQAVGSFPEVLPQWFGLVADGVTPDDDAIQGAHDALPENGGTVRFPSADILLSTGITSTKKGVVWKGGGAPAVGAASGEGATHFHTSSAIRMFDIGSASVTNHHGHQFENMTLQDDGGTALAGIRMRRMNHAKINWVSCINFNNTGACGVDSDGTGNANILHEYYGLMLRGCDTGLKMTASIGTRWWGGYINACTTGVHTTDVASNLIFDGSIDACTTGMQLDGDSSWVSGRFEGNTTAVEVTRNNNIISGEYQSNTTDINITGTANGTLIWNPRRGTGSMIIVDAGGNTQQIGKFGIETLALRVDGRERYTPTLKNVTATTNNDYNVGTTPWIRLNPTGSRNISGIVAGEDGEILKLTNVNGSNTVTLQNENAGSSAANRIITGTGADIVLSTDDNAELIYDATTARWRVVTNH